MCGFGRKVFTPSCAASEILSSAFSPLVAVKSDCVGEIYEPGGDKSGRRLGVRRTSVCLYQTEMMRPRQCRRPKSFLNLNLRTATERAHGLHYASLLRPAVRFGRRAHDRNAHGPQHLLRRRAEENLFDPALMPSANSHHDQTEMEIGRDAQNLRERLADHDHRFNADV